MNVFDHENIQAVTMKCSLDLDGEEDPVVTVKSVNIYQKNLQTLEPKCGLDCRVCEHAVILLSGKINSIVLHTDSGWIHAAAWLWQSV